MKLTLGIILGISYLINSKVVGAIFPNQETDYYAFVDAYNLRRKVYEVMFCLLFFACMLGDKGWTRAVFAFLFVICAASCFDKIVLNISHYLITDYLVVIVAIGAAYYRLRKERNAGQVR